jgi:hypothetical protein
MPSTKTKTSSKQQSSLTKFLLIFLVVLGLTIAITLSNPDSPEQPTSNQSPIPSHQPTSTPSASPPSNFPISQDIYTLVKDNLNNLTIRSTNPTTDYQSKNMPTWSDPDKNGCDARNDILARDLINDELDDDNCKFLEGDLVDPYTGDSTHFVFGENSTQVQIDHLVAKEDAWNSGGYAWSRDDWKIFINDPDELLATTAKPNQSKGGKAANEWLPPNQNFWCQYIILQVNVKTKYRLSVTNQEKETMMSLLDENCEITN